MPATVKKLSIKVDLDPYSEMDGKTKRWCLDSRFLKKTLKPIEIKEDVEVDTRKWDQKNIGEGIEAVARYEMKVFAVAVKEAMKGLGKAKPSDAADELEGAEAEVEKLYDRLEKDLVKKISVALDELQSGESDDKKALAAGKQVFSKIENTDFELVFKDIAIGCRAALLGVYDKKVEATLGSDKDKKGADKDSKGGDKDKAADKKAEKEQEQAEKTLSKKFVDCAKRLGELAKTLKSSAADAVAVVEFVESVGKKIAKDKDASDAMKAFGKDMTAGRKVFDGYSAAVDSFQKAIETIIGEVKTETATRVHLAKMADMIDPPTEGIKAAKAVAAEVQSLLKDFRKLEKDLK